MTQYVLIDHDGVHPEITSPAREAQIVSKLEVRLLNGDIFVFEATDAAGELTIRVHPSGALVVQAEGRGSIRVFGPAAWSSVDGQDAREPDKRAAWA